MMSLLGLTVWGKKISWFRLQWSLTLRFVCGRSACGLCVFLVSQMYSQPTRLLLELELFLNVA
uniref:Uncharacterized protein n=1 Tax=Lotus japonicus TaxID=34305 RepID=I3STF2_LOTJA|nr:unknown [Lotus japonicus]